MRGLLLLAALAVSAAAPVIDRAAPSTIRIVPRGPERAVITRTAQFSFLSVHGGGPPRHLLLTAVTAIRSATNLDFRTGRVAVTVEDADRGPPRRLARYDTR